MYKRQELQLTSEELHLLVAGYIGKDSLKELNGREIRLLVQELQRRKDNAKRQARETFPGNAVTVHQRKKIEQLAYALGWKAVSYTHLAGFLPAIKDCPGP